MPRILIVEDEKTISEPFEIILRTQTHTIDIASDGLEALKLCKKHEYDLILLDIMMPVCNGVEFLKKAELKKNSPKTKVIVLSNLAIGSEINEALSLGAKENILKASITPSSLINLVNRELNISQQA